jgi:hypothetical protein
LLEPIHQIDLSLVRRYFTKEQRMYSRVRIRVRVRVRVRVKACVYG